MSATQYVSKFLAAASSTSIGSISTAAGGTVTLSCVTLDTARRISVFSASLSGPTYTVTGLNQPGNQISETIVPSTTVVSVATTTQDFIKVTSVVLSCSITNSSGGFLIGTSTQGGTPWVPINTIPNPTNVAFAVNINSASTVVIATFEYTLDYPNYNPVTNTWGGSSINTGPRAIASSFASTTNTSSAVTGLITAPIAAWRMTIASTSSAAGSATCSVLQSGH